MIKVFAAIYLTKIRPKVSRIHQAIWFTKYSSNL